MFRKKNNRIRKNRHKSIEMLKRRIRKNRQKRKRKKMINEGSPNKIIKAPKIFSIFNNPNEVLDVFQEIKEHCRKNRKSLVLDMSDIEEIDVGALIYIKYIVYEIKEKEKKNMTLNFRAPKDKKLRDKVYSSGFVTYSKRAFYMKKSKDNNKRYLTLEETENFKIKRGNKLNREVLRKILEYIESKKSGAKKILYPIIHEMMENTVLHAYDERKKSECKDWYFFSDYSSEKIKFIFLDTGDGIIKTARKKWYDIFKPLVRESDILKEVLLGKHRTKTNKDYRGKGLPHIYQESNLKKILNLKIISNKSCFNLNSNNDLRKELMGTLFYWEIKIEGEKNESNL